MNIKDIQPITGYVLIKPEVIEDEKKTKSGLIIVNKSKDKLPQKGEVIAVAGDLKKYIGVGVGDTIIYKMWDGNDFDLDGVKYRFLQVEDILATVKK